MKKFKDVFGSGNLIAVFIVIINFTPIISILRYAYIVTNIHKYSFITKLLSLSRNLVFIVIPVAIFFAVIIWVKNGGYRKSNFQEKKVLFFTAIGSLLSSLFYLYLISLEKSNYTNFLYSRVGIQVKDLNYLILVNTFVVIVILSEITLKYIDGVNINIGNSRSVGIQKLYNLIVMSGVFVYISNSLFPFLNPISLINLSKQTYEQKFGSQYKYIPPMLEYISESATIIHPPQGSIWPAIGNQPVIRFFLFPRTLVSGAVMNSQSYAILVKVAYFIEVDPKNEISKWPIIQGDDKSIIFDTKTKIYYEHLKKVSENSSFNVFEISFK